MASTSVSFNVPRGLVSGSSSSCRTNTSSGSGCSSSYDIVVSVLVSSVGLNICVGDISSPLYPKALWCLAPRHGLFLYAYRLAPFFTQFLIGGIVALPLFPIFSVRRAGLNHPMPFSEGKPNPRCPPTNGLTHLLL